MSAANGIQESGGRQTHSRGRKPPVWGKENRSPEAPERTRRQRGPTESVALNMPCAHIRSRRSWLRAYALALICRPSASSAAPQALQGSISFSCVTGGSHLRLRLDEPPPATFCRPPDSQIPLASGSQGKRSLSFGLCSALKARAVSLTNCTLYIVNRKSNSSLVLPQTLFIN